MRHCDEYIDDPAQPKCLRAFLAYKRMPAIDQVIAFGRGEKCPDLFAFRRVNESRLDRVRVVMASRFGDVGITTDLQSAKGYEERVLLSDLESFSEEP